MLVKVSAPPSFVAEFGSGEQRGKALSLGVGFVGGFKSAGSEVHRSNIVSLGHDGHIVCAELSRRLLVDLDEEFQVVCGPARNNSSSGYDTADVWCERDVSPFDPVPSK